MDDIQLITSPHKETKSKKLLLVMKNFDMYLLLVPGLIYIIVFKYVPIYGLIIAFEKYSPFKGVLHSQWVGLYQFQRLFTSPEFYSVFRNTLLISLYKIVFTFPIHIAIILNEVGNMTYKRTVQTIIYLPHFLSWVAVAGLVIEFLSPDTGIVNHLVTVFGGKPISFLMDNHWFRTVLVSSEAWKEVGYSAIIYIASIAASVSAF